MLALHHQPLIPAPFQTPLMVWFLHACPLLISSWYFKHKAIAGEDVGLWRNENDTSVFPVLAWGLYSAKIPNTGKILSFSYLPEIRTNFPCEGKNGDSYTWKRRAVSTTPDVQRAMRWGLTQRTRLSTWLALPPTGFTNCVIFGSKNLTFLLATVNLSSSG